MCKDKQIRLVIFGGKSFKNYKRLSRDLDKYIEEISPTHRKDLELIYGDNRTIDKLTERYAIERGFKHRKYEAYWSHDGDQAGYLRNNIMLKHASKGIGGLFIFWDGKSIDAKNMVELATHYGIDELHVERY